MVSSHTHNWSNTILLRHSALKKRHLRSVLVLRHAWRVLRGHACSVLRGYSGQVLRRHYTALVLGADLLLLHHLLLHDPLLLVLHRVGVIRVDGRSIRIHSHLRIWYCLCAVLYLAWVCWPWDVHVVNLLLDFFTSVRINHLLANIFSFNYKQL